MENYKIITDETALRNFIEFLPELNDSECFYVTLLCRNKYTDKLLKDKVQLKRVTSNKEYLFDKIKQMECELGTYKYKGEPIPVESMCLYITPNPRSYEKAAKNLAKKLIDLCFDRYSGYNPQAEALTAIQKSCSRTVFMDFDNTTIKEMKPSIVEVVNQSSLTFVQTHGGFHVLIEVSKIEDKYKKTYYNSITKLPNVDARGDGLIPVPGATQGLFTPKLIKL